MQMNNVYIAEIRSIFPKKYSSKYIADKMYPSYLYGDKLNRLAKKLAKKLGVECRASVIDYELYPKIVLANPADHPRTWGRKIVNELTANIDKDDVGLFSLSYNVSYHTDVLPNLASQIIMDAKLTNLDRNDEIAHYGCALSIYSLDQAIEYCKKYDRPAIVFTFDQCTTGCLQLDKDDLDFRKMLISNLLFTDGGVGMLIIPERMRASYQKPLLKITDIQTKYTPGNLIVMKNGKFLMSSNLKNVVPRLVSNELIKPFLVEKQLNIDDISEWSIHQGGAEVIKQFRKNECLNLSEKQIKRSLDLFNKYGNTSAVSCLLVLESFFNDKNSIRASGSKGIMIGFGAGYYLGLALYEWDCNLRKNEQDFV
jgi:predicted naringenin-chalcone synthase